ncbi:GntR family transcriptional regulator [Pseudogracilibacillus auburnensis]|uniref:GntR family transcriptional regulator n=1 Tax=Pseudogracilibacillus auburnensis TaxID=1494959 RepID=UPI001A9741A1|nr:GntR family transcriptional regulator [Pseudogracilibacillus auburnensis]MBO1002177.1 GntR family transcriptional regulator [Pseudogracilibacillus auburnensis]
MNVPITLSKDSRVPIYHQIEKQLKALIAGGHLAAGATLPSIRVLSKDLEVSVITTRRAYQNLENDGFIQTIQGKGTFVAQIEKTRKEKTKESAVYDALDTAVRTAISYDYNAKQIMDMFTSILNEYQGGKK